MAGEGTSRGLSSHALPGLSTPPIPCREVDGKHAPLGGSIPNPGPTLLSGGLLIHIPSHNPPPLGGGVMAINVALVLKELVSQFGALHFNATTLWTNDPACAVGLAAPQASAHQIPQATPSGCDGHSCLCTWPLVSWGGPNPLLPHQEVSYLGETNRFFQTSMVKTRR